MIRQFTYFYIFYLILFILYLFKYLFCLNYFLFSLIFLSKFIFISLNNPRAPFRITVKYAQRRLTVYSFINIQKIAAL